MHQGLVKFQQKIKLAYGLFFTAAHRQTMRYQLALMIEVPGK